MLKEKYTIDDIQIFVITHNRADLISETIDSILNQTAGVKKITVLDNESTDNTYEVINKYKDKGVNYVKTTGFLGNFHKVQQLADKEYVMVFHDDDIMHPEYLKNALDILNREENVSAIYTRVCVFYNSDSPKKFTKLKKSYNLFKNRQDFSEYMYMIENIGYASAIYKTEIFKKFDIEFEKYNKFNDWPFMQNFADFGNIILLRDYSAYYARQHSNQDTNVNRKALTPLQAFNWVKLLNDNIKNKKNITDFLSYKNTVFLKAWYENFVISDYISENSLEKFYEDAKNYGIEIKKYNYPKMFSKLHNAYCKCLRTKYAKKLSIEEYADKLYSHLLYFVRYLFCTTVHNFR